MPETTMRTNWRTAGVLIHQAKIKETQTRSPNRAAVVPPHIILLFPTSPEHSGEAVVAENQWLAGSKAVLGATSIQLDPSRQRNPYRGRNAPEIEMTHAFLRTLQKAANLSHDTDPFGFIDLTADRVAGGRVAITISVNGQPIDQARPLLLEPSDVSVDALYLVDELELAEYEDDMAGAGLTDSLVEPVNMRAEIQRVVDACNSQPGRSGWLANLEQRCPCSAAAAHSRIHNLITQALFTATQMGELDPTVIDDMAATVSREVADDDGCGLMAPCSHKGLRDDVRDSITSRAFEGVFTDRAAPPPPAAEPFKVGW